MEDERKELQLLIYDDSGLVSRSGRHLVESPPAFLLVQTARYGTTYHHHVHVRYILWMERPDPTLISLFCFVCLVFRHHSMSCRSGVGWH